jgi:uncharacterized protein YjbJ (UPF0337 family)
MVAGNLPPPRRVKRPFWTKEVSVNRNEMEGSWKQLKGKVREKWGKLTDDDLETIQGRSERFVGKLQERYGQSQADAERDLDNWLMSLPPSEREEKRVREKQRV